MIGLQRVCEPCLILPYLILSYFVIKGASLELPESVERPHDNKQHLSFTSVKERNDTVSLAANHPIISTFQNSPPSFPSKHILYVM